MHCLRWQGGAGSGSLRTPPLSQVPRRTRLGAPSSGARGLCAPGVPRLGCEGAGQLWKPLFSLSLLSSSTVLCGFPFLVMTRRELPEPVGGAALASLSLATASVRVGSRVGSPAPRPAGSSGPARPGPEVGGPGDPRGGPGDS